MSRSVANKYAKPIFGGLAHCGSKLFDTSISINLVISGHTSRCNNGRIYLESR